jgi:membrane associated rhomboid family serine protease
LKQLSPTVLLALVCLCLAWHGQAGALELDRGYVQAGQLWRLWTCHIVHFGVRHMLFDVVGLVLAGLSAERLVGRLRTLMLCLAGAPAISLVLLALPDPMPYRGASALICLLLTAAGTMAWRTIPSLRLPLLVLFVGWIIKLPLDATAAGPSSLPANVLVAWQAHCVGMLLGFLAGLGRLHRADHSGPRDVVAT